jgi:UDP-2,3-diacylglucosamine hydrolase
VAVLPAPCYIVSDAHLGPDTAASERALLAFLEHVGSEKGSLVINGDLFEFWFEWRSVIPRTGFRVLASLAQLVQGGLPVVWIAGNHDCWGGSVLSQDVGVDYRTGAWEGVLAGWSARVEHGDGLRGREDRGYRLLRRIIRNRWAIAGFRLIPADWATRLALGSASTSRSYAARDGGAALATVARKILLEHPDLHLVVLGHSHVAALERVSGGKVYANPGAWLEGYTYLCVREDRIELRKWNVTSPVATLAKPVGHGTPSGTASPP